MTTLLLPNCDTSVVPHALASQEQLHALDTTHASSLSAWSDLVEQSLEQTPGLILGSEHTPAMAWMAARRLYPDARALCFETDPQHWRDIDSFDVWSAHPDLFEDQIDEESTATEVTPSEPETSAPKAKAKQKPAKKAKKKPQSQVSLKQMDDKQLLRRLFIRSAWGNQEREVKEIMFQLSERESRTPGLIHRAQTMKELGESANRIGIQATTRLKKTFNTQKDAAFDETMEWALAQKNAKHNLVQTHIEKTLEKVLSFLKDKATQQKQRSKQPESLLKSVTLTDGIHPNNVRYLKPSQQWTVVIDETGQVFDERALDIGLNNKDLGRVIALAIPQRSYNDLPKLRQDFHATNASDKQIDQNVQAILNSDVGVFGFTVKDQGLSQKQRWFDAINHLAYWTTLMLPMSSNDLTHLKFQIEQKEYGVGDAQLKLVQEELESRLKTLDPVRFEQLHITMEFIAKEDSNFNAYIDTIAHTWGSQAQAPKERLKRSQWLGHCLLHPNKEAIERLFLAVNAQKPMEPADWYDICTFVANEPKTSVLNSQLDTLAQSAQNDVPLWQTYMDYVADRLRTKRYDLKALNATLDWLERAQPEGKAFGALETLYLKSAKLAHLNHEGKVDYALVSEVFTLADQLKDENAQECAQVILRVATMTTNNFEFSAAQAQLEKWIGYDIAIPGLLNHAKLHSALGQLHAFQGQSEKAIAYFDKAIALFKTLSNPEAAQRDIAQTSVYKLIAQMDSTQAWAQSFEAWQNKQAKNTKQLARSGHNERYTQHTLLRGFICNPETFQSQIQEYLSIHNEWQADQDHPWPWINAYRGWLCVLNGQADRAQPLFTEAVNACTNPDNGITIRWIGAVICALAKRLNLELKHLNTNPLSDDYLAPLAQESAQLPMASLRDWSEQSDTAAHQENLKMLKTLVPFNFH